MFKFYILESSFIYWKSVVNLCLLNAYRDFFFLIKIKENLEEARTENGVHLFKFKKW